jgi:L-lactate dehydrogenase complex protein LldG
VDRFECNSSMRGRVCVWVFSFPVTWSQHLVVLLDESAIVSGLQAAYTHPVFQTARYAVFHTGPSATADIEGVLIHGAQGVRSLTVIV